MHAEVFYSGTPGNLSKASISTKLERPKVMCENAAIGLEWWKKTQGLSFHEKNICSFPPAS